MLEFRDREKRAVTIFLAVCGLIGLVGWWNWYHRSTAATGDLTPRFADGKPAPTVGPDGALDIPARGPDQSPPEGVAPSAGPATSGEIVVFVSGAVKRPNVYSFKPGARIYHAIRAAGGFKPNADVSALNLADALQDSEQIYVPSHAESAGGHAGSGAAPSRPVSDTARRLQAQYSVASRGPSYVPPRIGPVRPLIIPGNALAPSHGDGGSPAPEPRPTGRVVGKAPVVVAEAPLTDSGGAADTAVEPTGVATTAANDSAEGAASVSELPASKSSSRSRSTGSKSSGSKTGEKYKSPGDGVVNINTAGLEELQRLPGIGPAMGQRIIDYRTVIGRFASPEQLQDVKGIGAKKFEKMRPFVVVN